MTDTPLANNYVQRLVCMWVNAKSIRVPGFDPLIPSQFEIASYSKIPEGWRVFLTLPGYSSAYEVIYSKESKMQHITEYHRVRSEVLEALS